MAIRVMGCHAVAGGCMVAFVPDDDAAALFVRRACRVFGWAMGEASPPNWLGAATAVVTGATPAAFRAAFEGMPEFDFSSCRPPAQTAPGGTETMRRLE
jgi:hypothetical protein